MVIHEEPPPVSMIPFIRRCACCGAEYDLDACRCRVLCLCGCGKCTTHCEGHADGDFLFDLSCDRADDYDDLLELGNV